MLKAIVKNITLATCLALGAAFGANAQNAESLEDYKFSCSSAKTFFETSDSQCESFEVVYLEDNLEQLNAEPTQNEIAQRGSRIRRRTGKYYAGFTLGPFFANNIDFDLAGTELELDTGAAFGTSIVGGMKFNKVVGAEIELLLAFGGIDTDSPDLSGFEDADYSEIGFYISPKFEFALTRSGSFNLFVSPGVGLSITNISFQFDENFAQSGSFEDLDFSQTSIGFQVKGGGSLAIGRNTSILVQTRYMVLPTEDDFDTLNLFSVEGGLQFKF